MTNSKKLAQNVQAVAERLRIAAVWNGSRDAVDVCKDHYLYEILCYFHIAKDAKMGFHILISGRTDMLKDGSSVARWPKKPGKKSNFSFLRLRAKNQKNESFQLCPGIEVIDKHGKTRAPDANLLCQNAPDQPKHEHLRACWDAKYSIKPTSPVSDVAVSDFVYTFKMFEAPVIPAEWSTSVSGSPFVRSGIVTNAGKSSEPDAALMEFGITEISHFPDAPTTRP